MASSFTTLWTNDLCRALERAGLAGKFPEALFGGPHQSLPSFVSAGARTGDLVYPIRVHRKKLWVLGCFRIDRIAETRWIFDPGLRQLVEGDPLPERVSTVSSDWNMMRGSCYDEVVPVTGISPLRFDRAIPGDMLGRLTYVSRRGQRTIKHVSDGEITRAVSVHGIYRLHPTSATEIGDLVTALDLETEELQPRDQRP
ncbi:hypothetical protein [Antribacter gilvus]|uniref:hypothetical protein n=1 Tax=Antribacter gilvus TaxID=2304675 RepID=UPI000F788697|nr:hypothetical protein [Antribacter gilvus]